MYYFLFLFIILGGMIDFRIPYLNYWDEVTVLVVFILWMRKGILKSVKKDNSTLRLQIITIFLVGLGVVSNVIYTGIQTSYIAIIKDIFAFLKFPIIMTLLPQVCGRIKINYSKICSLCKFIVIVTLVFACVGYVVDIGVYLNDSGRLLKTFEFYYRHTTFFVSSYVTVLIVLIQDSMKNNKIYVLLTCFLLFMSQRTKAYFVIVVVIAIYLFGENRIKKLYYIISNRIKFKSKYIYIVLVVGVIAAWIIGKDKIIYHFSYGVSAARPALYIIGIKIMMDFFPIGSGWGTFASYISGEYYSGIYKTYGISEVNGLTQQKYAYTGDVFWPYIYGQLGVFGCIAYVYLIYRFFINQFSKLRKYDTIIAFLVLWIYALFASTAEAYFTNVTGVHMALMLTLFINSGTEKICEVEINE